MSGNRQLFMSGGQHCNAPAHCPTDSFAQLRQSDALLCHECAGAELSVFSPLDVDESQVGQSATMHMSLEQCIRDALQSSKVMRDLGVTVIRSPQTTNSTVDPAMIYTDPRTGEEAALSAFDAQLFASNMFESNNRKFNNQFFGVNGRFIQSLNTTQIGLSKRSATGSTFTVRNVTIADNNNQSGNQFPGRRQSWESFFEVEARRPLLLGAGTEFNRIAGSAIGPGQLNGVLLARTRTDISLVDFERSVRDLVAEVENAYWDLYYAYRDLEAKIEMRDIAEDTLRKRSAKVGAGDVATGDIAQAREQVLRFQSEIVDALNGRPIDGTRTNNGSSGGTFRGTGGVRVAERKLRLMIGLPINDGTLIWPTDTPTTIPTTFDWTNSLADALTHREELRRQRWVIKQSELELIANRNYLKPQLDLIARYRARGFSDQLLTRHPIDGSHFFDDDLQELNAGIEYVMPIGFRRAHAAVRNSELSLVRANEVLREQERGVQLGLSNAVADSKRSYESMNLHHHRLDAIVEQLNALQAREEAANTPELDVVLETHRRLLDARLRFHQSQIDYALSLRNIHFEKGTLLNYHSIYLAESASSRNAVADAQVRASMQDGNVRVSHRDSIVAE
ncbi:MAG: TolC family protein [Pirellulaceae bacterium]|nr:TolC family protein [Pirellulaceae bacterium]